MKKLALPVAALLVALSAAACESDPDPAAVTKDTGSPSGDGAADTGAPLGDSGSDTSVALTEEKIDDMESGTGSIASGHGRTGAWYVYNDETPGATQTPGAAFTPEMLSPARGSSKFAAHSKGNGFTTWGAGFGFNLNDKGDGDGGSAKALYDASAYSGITFWAKTGTASATTAMRVNFSTKSTDAAGGLCAPAEKCSDDYGTDVSLTTDWAKYTIMFSDLAQAGWGTPPGPAAYEADKAYAVHFQFAKSQEFDVWIDDISYIKK